MASAAKERPCHGIQTTPGRTPLAGPLHVLGPHLRAHVPAARPYQSPRGSGGGAERGSSRNHQAHLLHGGPDLHAPCSLRAPHACRLTRAKQGSPRSRAPATLPVPPPPASGAAWAGTPAPPRPARSAPPRCEVIKRRARVATRVATAGASRSTAALTATGRAPPAPPVPPAPRAVAAPASARSPDSRARREALAPAAGAWPGARGKAASRRAVTCTGFSMKTLIAAYSGVLRGEHRPGCP